MKKQMFEITLEIILIRLLVQSVAYRRGRGFGVFNPPKFQSFDKAAFNCKLSGKCLVFGDHQYGFRCNSSTTDHIFCIPQILEKKWDYNEAVHQLFINFKKAMIQLGGRSCIIFSWSLGSPRNW